MAQEAFNGAAIDGQPLVATVDAANEGSSSSHDGAKQRPALSVVVPTRNEAGNVGLLVSRIESMAGGLGDGEAVEVIFVDDSDDRTPDAVREIDSALDVRLIHRTAEERTGGLGGAVVEGARAARAPFVCVMDGDLQHPPEVIAQLLQKASESDLDLVVASRFCDGGDIGSFSAMRQALSSACSGIASLLFRKRLRKVTDPLSGFFLFRKAALDLDALRPKGFKILLEILVRTKDLRVGEVPFAFGERHAGETKASGREALRYLGQLASLRFGELASRFGRFGVVGATGLVVNTLLLAVLADVIGFYYVAAAILATQGSTLWNFALTELWVFPDRQHKRGPARRAAMFFAVNNVALALRVPLLFALTTGLGVHYLASNLISLLALTLARYVLADLWIWQQARGPARHTYDVHGIVSVASDVRLPELERFRVPELSGEPTVNVRIGSLKRSAARRRRSNGTMHGISLPNGNGTVNGLANGNGSAHANGSAHSNGTAHSNGSANGMVHSNGAGHNGAGENGSHANDVLRYSEWTGPFGFGVEIEARDDRFEVVAATLLRFSPHVLYTNVVEPILRWTFASKGYALVHAACFADGEHAYMITARTDTGKTTTTLKTLDRHPYAFVSDDLTLLCPDGRVLTYPKPLTISRHTVASVKTPLLTRRERATLIVQSRLHSRSGRRLAMIIAKLRLPAATINTVVQLLVPPPKYHVERLIPSARIAPEAKLAGLVVIQRGGTGEDELASAEALEILMSNCEDAYGFPPYAEIEGFLHSRNDSDLKRVERDIVSHALRDIPATLLRSETMDWWQRMPLVTGKNGNGARDTERRDEVSAVAAAQGNGGSHATSVSR